MILLNHSGNFIEKYSILTKDIIHSKNKMEKNILLQHMKQHTT